MTDLPPPPPRAARAPYKIAGPQTWALARELYLAGLPASEVAKRLGVSVHNLRKKATREGWSRRQHAETVLDLRLPRVGGDRRTLMLPGETTAPGREGAASEALAAEAPDEADPVEAAEVLARRAAGLARAGRAEEALGLLKTAEALRRAGRASVPGPAAEAQEAEPAPEYPPGVRPDALDRYLDLRPRDPWSPPPRTREEAVVARLLARLGDMPPPGGVDTALQRADACYALFEAAERRAAAEVLALPWGAAATA